MKDEHIIALLDNARFGGLSHEDNRRVEIHIDQCEDCSQAYTATRAAAILLQARAAEAIEPSPFFSTRVMVLIRERQSAPLLDLATIWRAARGFVLSAVSVVVLLAALTFLLPQPKQVAQLQSNYATEGVVFADEVSRTDDGPDDEQLMDEVFAAEDSDAGNQQ